jgi:hypothetical protein
LFYHLIVSTNACTDAGATAYFAHISHQLGRHTEVNKGLPSGIELAYDGLEMKF